MQFRSVRAAALLAAVFVGVGSVSDISAERPVEELLQEKQQLEEEIDGLDNELVDVMADIKQLETDIKEKEEEIKDAKADLKAAKKACKEQREDMKSRVKYMYENTDADLVAMMAASEDFGEFLNKVDYADEVHKYDRTMLSSYEATVEGIRDLKARLSDDRTSLKSDEEALQKKQESLSEMIEIKREESEDFDRRLEIARREAAEEEARRQQEQAAANAEAVSDVPEMADGGGEGVGVSVGEDGYRDGTPASASGQGTAVARYARKFVGYPYRWGGNSLTHGVDCSGFVVQIYKHFGVDLSASRQSALLRGVGRGVSFGDIQPGDIVCYEGHVAIYYGNGVICEAQSSNTGITISRSVTCKPIVAIRRVI